MPDHAETNSRQTRELSRQIERLEKILFTVAGLIIIGLLTLVYDKLL